MAAVASFIHQFSPFLTVCVVLLLIIVTWGWFKTVPKQALREAFASTTADYELLDPAKTMTFQGVSVPNYAELSELSKDQAEFPSVDGTVKGPKSMFAFAYNKCAPECCGQSGGVSCDRGCVCLTKEQKKMFNVDAEYRTCEKQ